MSKEYDERLQMPGPMRNPMVGVREPMPWQEELYAVTKFTNENIWWLHTKQGGKLSRWGKFFYRQLRLIARTKIKRMTMAEMLDAALKKTQAEYLKENVEILRAESELS